MNPTARTIKHLESKGYICGKVERYIWQAKRRIDLFGFIDVVAIDTNTNSLVGLQITTFSNLSAHVDKIISETRDKATAWLDAGGRIEVWTWVKLKPRGTKVARHYPRVTVIDLEVIRTGEYDWEEAA